MYITIQKVYWILEEKTADKSFKVIHLILKKLGMTKKSADVIEIDDKKIFFW